MGEPRQEVPSAAIRSSPPRSLTSRTAEEDVPCMPSPADLSPGGRFRAALAAERPLQVVGTIHAYAALLAKRAGYRALYLSGAGVANASRGLPDLGLTTLEDVLTDVRRITAATDLPLLVDADTAWDDPARTVREMIAAGAAAIHIE